MGHSVKQPMRERERDIEWVDECVRVGGLVGLNLNFNAK